MRTLAVPAVGHVSENVATVGRKDHGLAAAIDEIGLGLPKQAL